MPLSPQCRAAVFAVASLAVVSSTEAEARPLYKKVFARLYPTLGKVDCNVCHEGSSKTSRNSYGQALEKELGEKNVKDEERIEAALRAITRPKK